MKVANPFSEEVMLHCDTKIGTFHTQVTTMMFTVMEMFPLMST